VTLAADKAYDTQGFVSDLRQRPVTPHVAQNDKRRAGSAIDQRTTRYLVMKSANENANEWKRFSVG
jgi:hypothetical protein